ncbi:MAG: pilus assembly protein [Roseicyclus sp.]|uniref:pilus assembly protein n=1 Tax=Boseongicola sp. H5 TaxID=2763261 RepID=UPI001B1B20D8|nr:pilus assembly protein [Boseongicola sp. H5]MBO6602089.1 pilus assembly protein [Roseicyclus sp.]MBO6626356.1 pilus assembly protein [Roseicyclus sp.]MBO6923859.1 pilus assembly protein [Roseicyclus sp.]
MGSESGAVTVDWVVLTAALVGLGIAVVAVVVAGVREPTNSLNTQLGTDITDMHDWTGAPPNDPNG